MCPAFVKVLFGLIQLNNSGCNHLPLECNFISVYFELFCDGLKGLLKS